MKNWRIIFCSFLSGLLLFNSLRASFTYIYYNIDLKGFIETYCKNIDKPELECNGKCQLKKVIETNNKDNSKPIHLIDFKDILLYKEHLLTVDFKFLSSEKKQFFFYKNLYQYKVSSSLFHPPQLNSSSIGFIVSSLS